MAERLGLWRKRVDVFYLYYLKYNILNNMKDGYYAIFFMEGLRSQKSVFVKGLHKETKSQFLSFK